MRKALLIVTGLTSAGFTSIIPSRYDHPYKGTLYLSWSSPAVVHRICGATAHACALKVSKNKCLVIIIDAFKRYPEWKDFLFRHEQAHCNGWTRAHER